GPDRGPGGPRSSVAASRSSRRPHDRAASTGERGRPRPRASARTMSAVVHGGEAHAGRKGLIPFNVALVLPAQLTVMLIVLAPTLMVLWLAITDWQPTAGIPWWEAEPIWYWNFYDLWYDDRFIN